MSSSSFSVHSEHCRILSLDGGSFNGLSTLFYLESIVQAASHRARKELLPHQIFDLICGTGGGALIAALLGHRKLSCRDAISEYLGLASKLFPSKEEKFYEMVINGTILPTSAFEDELQRLFGEIKLVQDFGDERTARVMIGVVSDAPDFGNRLHCLRSYVVQDARPPGHEWIVREAIQAAVAARHFMNPLFIGESSYRDATGSGFPNLIPNALEDAQLLWPSKTIGIVLSLGTNLAQLLPKEIFGLTEAWTAKPQYAQKFLNEIPFFVDQPNLRKKAVSVLQSLMEIAQDAEITFNMSPKNTGTVFLREWPEAGFPGTVLTDIYYQQQTVEESIKYWLDGPEETFGGIDNIIPHLVEAVEALKPPPPPSTTRKDYNTWLDEPRPTNLVAYLRNYHIIFVIDDSGSMNQDDRWTEAESALIDIVEHAKSQGVHSVDIKFLNSKKGERKGVQGQAALKHAFQDASPPKGKTPTGQVLEIIFDGWIEKLNAHAGKPSYCQVPPLDIIVLTDGAATDEPKTVLLSTVKQLKEGNHHPNAIGVQIVQIGNDHEALPVFRQLKGDDVQSIVDIVPYDAKLTPARLNRILLGGLHPNMRALVDRS